MVSIDSLHDADFTINVLELNHDQFQLENMLSSFLKFHNFIIFTKKAIYFIFFLVLLDISGIGLIN